MTGVTICPECQKQVLVPAGTGATAQVECPLCSQQFALSAAIPDDAPVLQVIDAGDADVESVDLEADAGTLTFTDMDESEASEAPVADEASDESDAGELTFEDLSAEALDDEATDDEALDDEATDDEALDDEATDDEPVFEASGPDAFSMDAPSDADAEDAFNFVTDDEETSEAPVVEGESPFPADEATGIADFGDGDSATATATAPRTSQVRKKTAKKLGMKAQVLGIVGFGIVGIALGFGILHLIAPETARQIREGFGSRLSIASLWSSEADESEGSDDFVPGGALPEDQRPNKEEVTDVQGLPDPTEKDGADGGQPSTDDGQLATDDSQRRFTQLLNGQPDAAGVLKTIAAQDVSAAVTAAREVAAKSEKPNAKLFFQLCELGNKLAFVEKYSDGSAELARSEAAELIRQVGRRKSQARLSNYSSNMLYSTKRPKDKDGIFLVGKTQIIKPFGELFATEVEVTEQIKGGKVKVRRRVMVLSEERPDMTVHEPVGVLGTVVRDPVAKLPGYDPHDSEFDRFKSDDTLVVLAGVVTLLEKE